MNSCVISDPLKHLGFAYEVNRYNTTEKACFIRELLEAKQDMWAVLTGSRH